MFLTGSESISHFNLKMQGEKIDAQDNKDCKFEWQVSYFLHWKCYANKMHLSMSLFILRKAFFSLTFNIHKRNEINGNW